MKISQRKRHRRQRSRKSHNQSFDLFDSAYPDGVMDNVNTWSSASRGPNVQILSWGQPCKPGWLAMCLTSVPGHSEGQADTPGAEPPGHIPLLVSSGPSPLIIETTSQQPRTEARALVQLILQHPLYLVVSAAPGKAPGMLCMLSKYL